MTQEEKLLAHYIETGLDPIVAVMFSVEFSSRMSVNNVRKVMPPQFAEMWLDDVEDNMTEKNEWKLNESDGLAGKLVQLNRLLTVGPADFLYQVVLSAVMYTKMVLDARPGLSLDKVSLGGTYDGGTYSREEHWFRRLRLPGLDGDVLGGRLSCRIKQELCVLRHLV